MNHKPTFMCYYLLLYTLEKHMDTHDDDEASSGDIITQIQLDPCVTKLL